MQVREDFNIEGEKIMLWYLPIIMSELRLKFNGLAKFLTQKLLLAPRSY